MNAIFISISYLLLAALLTQLTPANIIILQMENSIEELLQVYNATKEEWVKYLNHEAVESLERISETVNEINRLQQRIKKKAESHADSLKKMKRNVQGMIEEMKHS